MSRNRRLIHWVFDAVIVAICIVTAAMIGGDEGALLAFLTGVIALGLIALALLVKHRNSTRQAEQERRNRTMARLKAAALPRAATFAQSGSSQYPQQGTLDSGGSLSGIPSPQQHRGERR